MSGKYKAHKRDAALEMVDQMPASLRACVHEFGLAVVTACTNSGVRDARAIRHLVKEIWAGARQPGQASGAYNTLDWVLMQAGAEISAARLKRVLAEYSLAIVPATPTTAMIEASMGEVSGFNELMTKREKHRRRLMAAIRVAMQEQPKLTMKPKDAA